MTSGFDLSPELNADTERCVSGTGVVAVELLPGNHMPLTVGRLGRVRQPLWVISLILCSLPHRARSLSSPYGRG